MYLTKSPWLLKKLYPKLTWHMPPGKPSIFLTFDDGPIPIVTPFVLKILKEHNAKATFFCIGDNVHKHPDVFEQVKNDGHAIGNHTYNHLNGWKTPDAEYIKNTLKTDNILQTNLFRPPYGRIKRAQVSLLQGAKPGMQFIMWDVLSGDFGQSITTGQGVLPLILERFWVSAKIVLTAALLASLVAVPAGMIAAWRQNSWVLPFSRRTRRR